MLHHSELFMFGVLCMQEKYDPAVMIVKAKEDNKWPFLLSSILNII